LPYYYFINTSDTAACWTNPTSANYNKFDIALNSSLSWVNGTPSGSTFDRQGTFTHEFGHAAGLNHNNSIPGNVSPDQASPSNYQTMYQWATDPLGNNLTYYKRTLEYDDISGVQYVASQIN
jgi:hypothetical protein